MPSEEPRRPPFDERAAAEELERLRLAVEESRRRRKDASEAFDAFVSSFRKEPAADEPRSRTRSDTPYVSALRQAPAIPSSPPAAPRKAAPVGAIVTASVVAIAAVVMIARGWRSAPPDQSTPAPAVANPAAAAPPGAAPALSAADAAAPTLVGGMHGELTAVRRVWVRATVDGVRVVERELDAGEQVPFRASRAIVIRAGDAGAVRMTIDGRDRGPVGEDGIALTRTYTASPNANR
jgi:hypothetical protein